MIGQFKECKPPISKQKETHPELKASHWFARNERQAFDNVEDVEPENEPHDAPCVGQKLIHSILRQYSYFL